MNIQKRLLKLRPPRVRITYDVETSNAIEKRELPFIIGIISDLYGDQSKRVEYRYRQFINIDRDNFDSVMNSIAPLLSLKVPNLLQQKKDTKLICNMTFTSMNSFSPDIVASQIPECNALLNDRKCLVDLMPKLTYSDSIIASLTEIAKSEKPIDYSKATSIATSAGFMDDCEDDVAKNYRAELIMAFSRQVTGNNITDVYAAIMHAIANIDDKLSKQIDEIIHDSQFQSLEARWRGLYDLVDKSETGEFLKIRLLPVSIAELSSDLCNASEFDQSRTFKLIYEEEYGTMGGLPFSCIVLDAYFGKSSFDINLLTLLSQVASASHAPMLSGTKPEMFGLRSFMDLHVPRDLSKVFESSEAASWNSFRETDESRYVNLFLPCILMRLPYSAKTERVKTFNYCESVDGESNDKFCWGNAAYAMAIRISDAISKHGWAAAIRGPEGGGMVSGLPAYSFKTSFADIALKCPTQTQITDRREKELSELGFIALCHKKMTDQAVFFSGQSVQKAKKYSDPDSNANAVISTRMPYILNASRFVHYIKVIMRDKIGSFQSARQVEFYLQDWIAQYVLLSDDADQATKAEYPLREAEIIVEDVDDHPGEYNVTMRLRPHFQMEAANISVRFVAKVLGRE